MAKQIDVNAEEFKVVMAYRHKNDLAMLQEHLRIAMLDISNNPPKASATPQQVVALRGAAEDLEDLMTQCGFIAGESPETDLS